MNHVPLFEKKPVPALTRRNVLRAGASLVTAPGIVTLITGCGPSAPNISQQAVLSADEVNRENPKATPPIDGRFR